MPWLEQGCHSLYRAVTVNYLHPLSDAGSTLALAGRVEHLAPLWQFSWWASWRRKNQASSASENIGLVCMTPLTSPEFMAAQHLKIKKAGHNSCLCVLLPKTRDLQAEAVFSPVENYMCRTSSMGTKTWFSLTSTCSLLLELEEL